ncbi:homoserine kinase [Kangiella sp. M94]
MKIKVFAPASIGNFSVGYDLLGAALQPVNDYLLGDIIEVSRHCYGKWNVKGPFHEQLPANPEDNIIYHCLQFFNQQLESKNAATGREPPIENLSVTLDKRLPVGSGLGSSSSSIVAMMVALNHWYKQPFTEHELLQMMGKMEAQISGSLHYDNIAPCYLGGLQLMGNDGVLSRQLPWNFSGYFVVANPGTRLMTKQAREVLPKQLPMQTTIAHAANLANFIQSLYEQDEQQLYAHFNDLIAEPYRQDLLPDYVTHKTELLKLGAKVVGISGSGPTLFTVANTLASAEALERYLASNYRSNDQAFCYICQLSSSGARIIAEE